MQVDGALTMCHSLLPLRLLLLLALATSTSLACIEEQRRVGTDATAPADTEPDADPDADLDDSAAPDATAETRPDATSTPPDSDGDTPDAPDWETATSDCATDEDCADRTAGECRQWVCNRGWCTEGPASGTPCDDGDQCTVDDFCDQGVCAAGWVLTCDMLAPDCWGATGDVCNPDTGCPGVAAPAGMACYDGVGLEGGTCYNGWVVPEDRCDGLGRCLDQSALVPTSIHPLAGSWHMILTRRPVNAAFQTLTAQVAIGPEAVITLSSIRTTDAAWGLAIALQGRFCATLEGLLELTLGDATYQGVATPDTSFIALQGGDDTMGIMLRATGDREDVTGTYNAVVLEGSRDEPSSFVTRVGSVVLQDGCVVAPSALEPTVGVGGTLEISDVEGDCFALADGRQSLSVSLLDNGVPLSNRWSGAIGPNGDILLLARDEAQPSAGTVLLVRARGEVPASELEDGWYWVSRRRGLDARIGTPRVPMLEAGLMQLGASTSDLSGYLIDDLGQGFLGQWWYAGAAGRYSQRVAIDDELVHHTGFITARPDVIIGWVAQDPENDTSRPQTLRLAPKEGSLFVGVRWHALAP